MLEQQLNGEKWWKMRWKAKPLFCFWLSYVGFCDWLKQSFLFPICVISLSVCTIIKTGIAGVLDMICWKIGCSKWCTVYKQKNSHDGEWSTHWIWRRKKRKKKQEKGANEMGKKREKERRILELAEEENQGEWVKSTRYFLKVTSTLRAREWRSSAAWPHAALISLHSTWMLGRRPRRKPLIVPKWPLCLKMPWKDPHVQWEDKQVEGRWCWWSLIITEKELDRDLKSFL